MVEVKLNLFKVNANREQYKTNRICFYGRGEAETLGNIQVQQTDIKQNTANEPAKGMLCMMKHDLLQRNRYAFRKRPDKGK